MRNLTVVLVQEPHRHRRSTALPADVGAQRGEGAGSLSVIRLHDRLRPLVCHWPGTSRKTAAFPTMTTATPVAIDSHLLEAASKRPNAMRPGRNPCVDSVVYSFRAPIRSV